MALATPIFRVKEEEWTLKMEFASFIETSVVIYKSTWSHSPDDLDIHQHR
jgi:hypothetical protein